MSRRNIKLRRGISVTEVLVAAILVMSIIGLVTPFTIRVGRVWQSTRQYRLAFNELANRMEMLTDLGLEKCNSALKGLTPSQTLSESLPGAQLKGEVVRDQDGTRLVLTLDWDRGAHSVPLSLVGWFDTEPVALDSSATAIIGPNKDNLEFLIKKGLNP